MAASKKKGPRERLGAPPSVRPVEAALDFVLHPQAPAERPWKYLPWVLALAFATRVAVALSGDFVLHPDEIMQYLEPAHRLVFDNGVRYWEYFYGARSWLVPGAVAGVLKLFDVIGLGQPWWYVGGIKVAFCALSLLIPAGMYVFARRHFGETTARAALVAGAFWYEMAGFAHKPMTEFVAAVPLMGLLTLSLRPSVDDNRTIWLAAMLSVLTVAIRMQYAPMALVLMGVVFLRTRKRVQFTLVAAGCAFAVGVFDAVTWDGGLFQSYILNLRYNLFVGPYRASQSPPYQFLLWLVLAGGGLSAVCLVASLCNPRRYGFVLALIALILLVHSLQDHKEYRFVFAVIPLWLVIGADLTARLAARAGRWVAALAAAAFAVVSLAGILNSLPYQQRVYKAWSGETGYTGFVGWRDPAFAAYRYLARAPGVKSVWHVDRLYLNTPGYYYLHRRIPFYDSRTGRNVIPDMAALYASVSHIVSANPKISIPGYSLEREFGRLRILRRDKNEPRVREWSSYSPIIVNKDQRYVLPRIDPAAPMPPANAGIRFTSPAPAPGGPKIK